ncbi:branched chain amino acid ABC transporter [Neokomagataea thailandica NBRC 106555]|uniref:Branched-chain amino acid ABC transporter permease n=2 Tax=Neokomagataea TaxID=1223423 RepID=A0A4Y6V984_9PROT|nr:MULTISPECIES: AzlC family ABC transporter permease [Neokomagataea]QDH25914.1 branched-chain amino acid ABC transporter permease [Neokomagataea tanensis]GBR51624.1 branched chain amino acid ABC transporter [Neokomagataea thailandica NBRC 106555]
MSDNVTVHSASDGGFWSEFLRGVRTSLPVIIGFIPFGLLLGRQAVQHGMTMLSVPLMTGLNYGGGSEFAAVNLWTSPLPVALIISVTLLINCRHILMGAALAPWLKDVPRKRAVLWLFLMCDETWAISLSDTQKRQRFSSGYYFGVGWSLYVTWIVSTFLGAYLGGRIGDLTQYGFDMAFPAVFLVILRGMWKDHRMSLPWVVSLLAGVLVYRWCPGAWCVPAGTVAGAVTAACVVRGVE